MRKKLYFFFLGFYMMTFFLFKKTHAKEISAGITLDCARTYFSVKEIKVYIDLLSNHPSSFLQLHLTDNENVGLVCKYLGQTEKTGKKLKNSYQNPYTGKKFLSKKEIKLLISYAKKKRVELIPEIDAPSHVGGFLTLAAHHFGTDFVKEISHNFEKNPEELNLSNKKALVFLKKIYAEYSKLFSDCKYFHIGCDEVFFSSNKECLAYIKEISSFLKKKGFTVRMWNDLLLKKDLSVLDKEIEVTYWSFDGDVEDKKEKKERRKYRASLPDLQKKITQETDYVYPPV